MNVYRETDGEQHRRILLIVAAASLPDRGSVFQPVINSNSPPEDDYSDAFYLVFARLGSRGGKRTTRNVIQKTLHWLVVGRFFRIPVHFFLRNYTWLRKRSGVVAISFRSFALRSVLRTQSDEAGSFAIARTQREINDKIVTCSYSSRASFVITGTRIINGRSCVRFLRLDRSYTRRRGSVSITCEQEERFLAYHPSVPPVARENRYEASSGG